jgi:vacuolar-type H+-ATPase subunit I/STV1
MGTLKTVNAADAIRAYEKWLETQTDRRPLAFEKWSAKSLEQKRAHALKWYKNSPAAKKTSTVKTVKAPRDIETKTWVHPKEAIADALEQFNNRMEDAQQGLDWKIEQLQDERDRINEELKELETLRKHAEQIIKPIIDIDMMI